MPAGYEVIQVAKKALVYECSRCGAVVLHPTIHDAYHVAEIPFALQVYALWEEHESRKA